MFFINNFLSLFVFLHLWVASRVYRDCTIFVYNKDTLANLVELYMVVIDPSYGQDSCLLCFSLL